MTIVALTAGGVLVALMVGIAVFGWRTLPADARVPIHYGVGSWDNFAFKTFGLLLRPVVGLLIYGVFAAIMDSRPGAGRPAGSPISRVPDLPQGSVCMAAGSGATRSLPGRKPTA